MKKIQLLIVLIPLLVVAAGCQSAATNGRETTSPPKSSTQDIDGAWSVTSEEVNGKKAPEEEVNRDAAETLVFHEGKGSIRRGDEGLGEFTFNTDPGKTPKTIDLLLTKGSGDFEKYEGKKTLAIYERNGDTLKVCWTLFAADRGRPTEFATAPDSGLLLVTYKHAKE